MLICKFTLFQFCGCLTMTSTRWLVAIFASGFVLALCLNYLPQWILQRQLSSLSEMVGGGEEDEVFAMQILGFVHDRGVSNPEEGSQSAAENLAGFIRPQVLDSSRSVSLALTVSRKSLLAGNVDTSDSKFWNAKAADMAQAECKVLVASIASGCKVLVATSEFEQSSPDVIRLRLTLAITQKDAVGDVSAFKKSRVAHEQAVLDATAFAFPAKPAVEISRRTDIYKKAASTCRQVKSRAGNCVLSRIRIEQSVEHSDTLKTKSFANFTTLTAM
jgi:hypothetical protein